MKKLIVQIFTFLNLILFINFSSLADTFVYSGGCFWCTEADMEKLEGVSEVVSGFTAGTTKNPKYIQGQWGDNREAALVTYDPQKINFKDLVIHVYKTIDYEDNEGQFCDRGRSYTPAIYYKTNYHSKSISVSGKEYQSEPKLLQSAINKHSSLRHSNYKYHPA